MGTAFLERMLYLQRLAHRLSSGTSPGHMATAQRTAATPGGVQKGEVNVKTPNVAELLVQQTEKATRLEVENEQLRAEIDRLKAEIDRLNKQQ